MKLNLKFQSWSQICDYNDADILVIGTITINGAGTNDNAKRLNNRNKGVIFKNCAPLNDWISKISNTQIDNTKDLRVVMPNLIQYSNNYSKTSGGLWQYYRNVPNDILTNSKSFKFKVKITGETPANSYTKDVKIALPLNYLSNFWRTLESL